MRPEEDSKIISEILAGNKDKFVFLYKKYCGLVYLVICSGYIDSRDRELVERLVQDVFVKAYFNLSSLKDHRKFGAWIWKIAQRTRRDGLPAGQSPLSLDVIMESLEAILDARIESPFALAMREEFWTLVEEVIDNLSVTLREVAHLRYRCGMSPADIAVNLGISVDLVDSRCHQAKTKLYEALKGRLGLE